MKKFLLLSLTVLLCSTSAWAYDFFTINEDGIDIFYNILDETTVEVTYKTTNSHASETYCGVVKIPAIVDYDGTNFSVVGIGKSAFINSFDLNEVVLPEGITYIEREAFFSAESLATINFPKTLTSIGYMAFWNTALNEVTLPEGLTSIEDCAFCQCKMETITIPNSVTYLGVEIFDTCTKLTTATLGTGVTYVPDYMFVNCPYLEEVCLPDCITSIGNYAFAYCNSLSNITIPDGVETIGNNAFEYCFSLFPTYLPSNLKYIGTYAFGYCFNDDYGDDVSLTIPESVTYIGKYAFHHCYYLAEVTLLADIDAIETGTFMLCSRLTTIEIPKMVALIESDAFNRCQSLVSITSHNPEAPICDSNPFSDVPTSTCVLYVPKGAKEAYATAPLWCNFAHIEELDEEETPNVDENKFEEDDIYYYITDSEAKTVEVTYKSTSFDSYSGSVVIPESVTHHGNTYQVVGIGYSAFRASTNLTEVTIPESITYVDTYAFYNCTALKGVSLSHSITEIGDCAFYHCTGITGSLIIPASVTYIGVDAFAGGTWKELILEDGEQTLELDEYAIYGCTIGTLYVGRDMSFSGEFIKDTHSAFLSERVSNIIFSERITYLCDYEFFGCLGFEELVIPEHITTFGEYVFANCTDLANVTFLEGITTLGKYMFTGCTGLREVSFPEEITDISYTFMDSGLEEITIPNSITDATYAFERCSSLKKVVLSEGFATISQGMFRNCTALEDVTFPSTLTRISQNAFYGCTSLKEVVPPEGVTSLLGFSYCTSLSRILLPQSLTSVGNFQHCESLKKIVIPKQITTLGADFFRYCSSLEEIVLLGNIPEFSYTMFSDCPCMQRLYSLTPTPPTKDPGVLATDNLFKGLDTDECVLYVPVGAKETYANDENWYVFTHIEELGEPLAITYGTTARTTDYAEITGYIAVGTVDVEEVGFEYWADDDEEPTVVATSTSDITTGSISLALEELGYGMNYTYRAYAKTANGTIYGDELEFSMPIDGAKVFTLDASSITGTTAVLNGRLVLPDDESVTEQGFEYWAEGGEAQSVVVSGDELTYTLENLSPETTYTYYAFATLASGSTIYGEEVEFTTLENTDTGITNVKASDIDGENIEGYYTPDGRILNAPQKGVTIVRYTDGAVKKIYVSHPN